MILFDSNVIIDAADPEADCHVWARSRLFEVASDEGILSPVVAAELASGMLDRASFDTLIAALPLRMQPIGPEAAFRAGQAFRSWIAGGGRRDAMLPDLLIGAQAASLSAPIVTRDVRRFRRYFPEVELITPDTHP